MAEYIDRNLIEWYGCNYENTACENRECSDCSFAECSHSQVMQISTADVIERTEYEKLRLVNLDLAETNKGLLAEHEQLEKLRSKIDKAIEELRKEIEENHLNVIDYADGEWIVKDFVYGAIDRLKEKITLDK